MDQHVTDAFARSGLSRGMHLRGICRRAFVDVSTKMSVGATVRSAADVTAHEIPQPWRDV